ncbi:diguanylate cyclase [Saccharibacillus sp. CPCC 101409]|uniref:sensor domain-containing diguanylate cyclase n=1 Tax=Saccharibacillus sp. CPCC 101409 TaxID=3058041 RepID=UPI002672BE9E|nr:diguanylate cyclase [Saccharibacillus sp. CPCC 101409]MDO3412539.1 diguanylate cyclase [Saccharibacillus sp. CPCC 101409]
MIKIRTFLALIFVSFVVLLSASLGSLMSSRSTKAIEKEIGVSLAGTAYQMSDKLDNFMWSRSGEIKLLSELGPLKRADDPAKIQNLLNQTKAGFPSFSWIGFTNMRGDVIAGTDGILVGKNIAERPVFKEGVQGNFVGDVHEALLLAKLLPNPSGEPLQFVDFGVAVENDNGQKVGVLAAHLSWEWAKEVERTLLQPQIDHNQNFELFIVSRKDNTVLLGRGGFAGKKLDLGSIASAQSGENSWKLETWPDGKRYLTGYAYGDGYMDYPGLGWTVLVRQPESVAFAPVKDIQKDIVWAGLLASIVFAVIGLLSAQLISHPIRKLTAAADRIRRGAAPEIPQHRVFKDISSLTRSLGSLLDSLLRTENALGDMRTAAHCDQLTGLPNRLALEQYLEQTIEGMDPCLETLSFMYLDLDGFKKVNDTLGHHVGDVLLQKAARRLQSVTRPGGITVRLGGDEFLLIARSPLNRALTDAQSLAADVLKQLNSPFVVGMNQLSLGCSIGVAFYSEHSSSITEVIQTADECLYLSKQAGKNRVTFHKHDKPAG